MNLLLQSIRSITVPKLKEKLLKNPALFNVRTPAECRGEHTKGAKNVPLQNINGYDGGKEETVCMICQSGMRGKQTARELKKSGYDVVNIHGSMNQ